MDAPVRVAVLHLALAGMMLLQGVCSSYAQPSMVNCSECSAYNFPFRVCSQGRSAVVCTSDPYNVPDAVFRPMCLPPQFFVSAAAGPGRIRTRDASGAVVDVYDPNNLDYWVSLAMSEWTGICGAVNQQRCDNCPLVVAYSRNPDHFGGEMPARVRVAATSTVMFNDCTRQCEGTFIALNNTPDFSTGSSAGLPLRGVYEYYCPSADNPDVAYYSLRTVLQHEIGHWLGLPGLPPLCPPMTEQSISTCIMYELIPPCQERSFCNTDKCMFLLMYCCGLTSSIAERVEKFSGVSSIRTAYRSADDAVEVNDSFVRNLEGCEMYSIGVISVQGKIVWSGEVANEADVRQLLESLANGVYLLSADGCGRHCNAMLNVIR